MKLEVKIYIKTCTIVCWGPNLPVYFLSAKGKKDI